MTRDDHDCAVPTGADVDDDLVQAFLATSRALVAVAARSLAGQDADLTLVQYRALVVLASHGPDRVQELGRKLGVDTAEATRACDGLQRRGLLQQHPPAVGAESEQEETEQVCVSEEGRRLVLAVTRARRDRIAEILAEMPAWARGQVLAGLRIFTDLAGELPEQDWSMGWNDVLGHDAEPRGGCVAPGPGPGGERPTTESEQ